MYRSDYLVALQTQCDGLDLIEDWVDEGGMVGDAYENLTELAIDRAQLRALIDKVAVLSDQQIANIGIYCLRFLEQQSPANG